MLERGLVEATAAAMMICRGKTCNALCVEPNEPFGTRRRSTVKAVSCDSPWHSGSRLTSTKEHALQVLRAVEPHAAHEFTFVAMARPGGREEEQY